MANNGQQLQSENTKLNFGKGWIIIFYSMIMFWFLIGGIIWILKTYNKKLQDAE